MSNKHLQKIPCFDSSEIALSEANFTTCKVIDDNKKKEFFNSFVTFCNCLCNLTALKLPSDKNQDDFITLLKNYFLVKASYHRSFRLFQQKKKSPTVTLKEISGK